MEFLRIIGLVLMAVAFGKPLQAQIKDAAMQLINDKSVRSGHIGIKVFDLDAQKTVYDYNADKYFIPASCTKVLSMYAGLKYLGDSIKAIQYFEDSSNIYLLPTGDPTLLHPDFAQQRLMDFLGATKKNIIGLPGNFTGTTYGTGWAWDDYIESFMNERGPLPVFGNNTVFRGRANGFEYFPKAAVQIPEAVVRQLQNTSVNIVKVQRDIHQNIFTPIAGSKLVSKVLTPFITSIPLAYKIIADTLHKPILFVGDTSATVGLTKKTLFSYPVDSILMPMMHESDNFFAEQTLLMAATEKLGYMNTDDMIASVLSTDFKDMPNEPRWVDGSGLSRYNLISPNDFVFVLQKMKSENDWHRITTILPTGGKGTLKGYYGGMAGKIFAKTGTVSNNFSLVGYIKTEKGKALAFAVMANNFIGSASPVRRAIEQFLGEVYKL